VLPGVEFTEEQRNGLNLALDEAQLLGFELDPSRQFAGATFKILTLPEHGPCPEDRRVQVLLGPVGRVAAVFWRRASRSDPWELRSFDVDDLLKAVQSVGPASLSGSSFFDVADPHPDQRWPSLDWSQPTGGQRHSLTVYPQGEVRALELRIWFDRLELRLPPGKVIALDEFIAGNRRWWDGLNAGDPRTDGFGIYAGQPEWVICSSCGASLPIASKATSTLCTQCGSEFRR
jgi:hypothetical protein